jgi:predicted lipoprotein with Yx(FWY)xxD motif
METERPPGLDGRQRIALRVIGGGLLVTTGAIHLDLYLTGYRSIPTIGWLFLLQVIAALGLGVIVLLSGNRLASAAGALFALSTLGGYLLSLRIGLFGFREVRTTAGIVAGLIEIAAFGMLATLAVAPGREHQSAEPASDDSERLDRLRANIPGVGRVVGACSALALVLFGVSVAATEPTENGSSRAPLNIATIHGLPVLTNSRGFTLYWFAPDTPTKSNCNGTCAAYWPPVIGSPSAGPGVMGKVGTIKRPDGLTQSTYGNHPLYTYIGDSAPGQTNGNRINLNGREWYEVVASH